MKSYLFAVVVFGLILSTFPNNTFAYFTTNQEAFRINDNLALFQIEYSFGKKDESVYLPVRAARDQKWGTKNQKIGFEILKDGTVTDEGEAIGVVTAPVMFMPKDSSNEQYVTPPGMAVRMSLYVVLEVPPSATSSSYRVQVTDLPFYVGEKKEYQKLNPSELQYYRSPAKKLNRNLPVPTN
jgi:hypothetical protein